MGEILPRHYIIAGIIFTLLVLGVFSSINMVEKGSLGDKSDAVSGFIQGDGLTEFNRSFNKIDNLTTDITDLKTKIKELKPENTLEIISLPVAFVQSAWAAMKVVINMFGFMDSAFEGLSGMLGVPSWIPALLILIVIVVLVFGVLTVIFGKEA